MRIELCRMLREPSVLADALGARLVDTRYTWGESAELGGIATDSREVEQGDLFVALRGARTDGAAYIPEALARGAVGVLAPLGTPIPKEHALFFEVDDPIAALTRAAAFRRERSGAFVIAVSGSTGKTTAKEGLATLLGYAGTVVYSEGNFNSSLGFPLSLLSFDEASYWVVELGINHVGEMEPMARAAHPDLAVLTNVGTAHIGYFGDFSTLLAEKARLASRLTERGLFLAPAELPAVAFPCSPDRIRRMGNGKPADFYMENVVMSEKGVTGDLICPDRVITNLTWSVPGQIGASALTTIAAAGVLAGCTDRMIRAGLSEASEKTPRLRTFTVGERLLVDDTYNASPESVIGALEVLRYRASGRPRVAVLGDMLELGTHAAVLHRAVGEVLVRSGISMLFTYGRQALHIAEGARRSGMPAGVIFSFGQDEQQALAKAVCRQTPRDAAVLFKASGRMALGRVVGMIGRSEST